MTNYSRSVLKSNGLRHSKNSPVKFGFSPKTVPANIAKKLPPQCCSKPLLIPFFNFSHKRPTFAFTGESGYTLGFRRKIAHSGLHGETGGVSDGGGITTLGAFCAVRKPCVAGCQNGKLCRFWALVGSAPEKRREPAGQRCAYARRCPAGVAAPLGCVIPLLFLSPHRWASRFCSAASLAHRKLSACSLVTAVRFLNRCSRRSMRETYPLGQRSGCRF